ncbi:DUF6075 family protein [Mycolicibacterium fortuitum]|uniref:DUF6075 family protein n=1 Tax=Paenibacillus sp. FSL W8-1287 TaxID=2954653 RepID=UPI001CE08D69|nr:hypothetical protein [Mycolicibacterium fortuitum]
MIPNELKQDRYWKGMLYIFLNNYKLQKFLLTHFDFQECTIDIEGLKRSSRGWSTSEKFMLSLALHLFNERNKINLSDMDLLDPSNMKIALKAIQMRFVG